MSRDRAQNHLIKILYDKVFRPLLLISGIRKERDNMPDKTPEEGVKQTSERSFILNITKELSNTDINTSQKSYTKMNKLKVVLTYYSHSHSFCF
jgi:hypothetical protein